MKYQYRCVSSGNSFELGKKQNHSDAVDLYEDYLNQLSEEGWEFVAVDEVMTMKPAGCMLGLFGKKYERRLSRVVIFRKEL